MSKPQWRSSRWRKRKSSITRGNSTDPKRNRLPILVEDHHLSHLDREDPTPLGPNGEPRVRIRDQGTYKADVSEEDRIVAILRGECINGPVRRLPRVRATGSYTS